MTVPTVVEDGTKALIDQWAASCGSRFEAAESVRDAAQGIMDAEKSNRITELRRMIQERDGAEKELAALGAVGRPRKVKRKRAAKGAEATNGQQ